MDSDLTENVLKFRMRVVETEIEREMLLLDLWSLSRSLSRFSAVWSEVLPYGNEGKLINMRVVCVCVCMYTCVAVLEPISLFPFLLINQAHITWTYWA